MNHINILLPTRGRCELVDKSIKSLCDKATHRDLIMFHLGVDNDDTKAVGYNYYNSANIFKTVFSPLGYKNLHLYYNVLSILALQFKGWLFLWNDDLIMSTEGWDDIVREYDNQFVVISPQTENTPQFDCLFPIIPTDWIFTTGRFSNNAHNDTWVEMIAKQLGILRKEPRIKVFHDRADFTGNNNDETFKNREYVMERFADQHAERTVEAELLKQKFNL